jgi:hypothetical protein
MVTETVWNRMCTVPEIMFCYDLGIYLTSNDCCHEDTCPYAARCLLMNKPYVDTSACVIQELQV